MYLYTKQLDYHIPVPLLHQALQMSLYDEFRAQAAYRRILETFGQVEPFVNILDAETRHINALLPLFYRYQAPMPINDWYPHVPPAPTLRENCELGVAGEIQNAQMYAHLLAHAPPPDVAEVFGNLQRASYYRHLPAFRRCARDF